MPLSRTAVAKLAVCLGALGALAGGAAVFYTTPPTHTGTGLIRLRPIAGSPGAGGGLTPLFRQFVASQVKVVCSQRVFDLAIRDKRLGSFGGGQAVNADFRRNVTAQLQADGATIAVSFSHTDPQHATVVVEAVIEAYATLFDQLEEQIGKGSLKDLRDEKAEVDARIEFLRGQLALITREHTPEAIDRQYTDKLQQLHEYEAELNAAELGLELDVDPRQAAMADQTPTDASQPPGTEPHVLRLQQQFDQTKTKTLELSQIKRRIEQIGAEIEQLDSRVGPLVARIEKQTADAAASGRVEVLDPMQVRLGPVGSRRQLSRAAAGAGGGFVALGLIGALAGWLWQRRAEPPAKGA